LYNSSFQSIDLTISNWQSGIEKVSMRLRETFV